MYKLCSKEQKNMEIKFENKNVSMYREISRQTKKVQESAESVVPDTDDDIGRIATVQSYVMLKSKDNAFLFFMLSLLLIFARL